MAASACAGDVVSIIAPANIAALELNAAIIFDFFISPSKKILFLIVKIKPVYFLLGKHMGKKIQIFQIYLLD